MTQFFGRDAVTTFDVNLTEEVPENGVVGRGSGGWRDNAECLAAKVG